MRARIQQHDLVSALLVGLVRALLVGLVSDLHCSSALHRARTKASLVSSQFSQNESAFAST
jgi:hypothetical protein